MTRIGIFGGTFNPPHMGHVQAVTAAREELGLDRVLLIPAAVPPHKQLSPHSPDADMRLELTRLAVAQLPWAEASDIELRRSGPSYTADTLTQLAAQYPEDELVLLVGTDMFLTLDKWYHPETICRLARIAFAARTELSPEAQAAAETQRDNLERRFGARVSLLHNPVRELSSSTVRRMLAFGCAGPLLPPPVAEAIERHGFYRAPSRLRQLPMAALEEVCLELVDAARIPHVQGCRDTAVRLAERYGCDPVEAARAGLLHDVTKALPPAQQLQLCADYGMMSADLTRMQPQLFHAITGSLVAERVFGECAAVCGAIRWHTTGSPGMTRLEQILYLADMIEPTRHYEGVETLRQAAERDLHEALCLSMERTVTHLRERGLEVSPETEETLQWLRRSET